MLKQNKRHETRQSQIRNGTIHGYYIHSCPPPGVTGSREAKPEMHTQGTSCLWDFCVEQVQNHSPVHVSFIRPVTIYKGKTHSSSFAVLILFLFCFFFLLFRSLLVCPRAGANTALESFTFYFSLYFYSPTPPKKESNQMILDAMAPISTMKIAAWVKETHVREITGCIVLCFLCLCNSVQPNLCTWRQETNTRTQQVTPSNGKILTAVIIPLYCGCQEFPLQIQCQHPVPQSRLHKGLLQ